MRGDGAWQRGVGFDFPVLAEHRAKSPPGSVPLLEDQGGVAIGESVAQMLYLAWRYGPTPLLPTDPAAMALLQITVSSEAMGADSAPDYKGVSKPAR